MWDIRIPEYLQSSSTLFRFEYDASHPEDVYLDQSDGSYKIANNNSLRVWTKDARQERIPLAVDLKGDYVGPGEYSYTELVHGQEVLSLYIEGVAPAQGEIKLSYLREGESKWACFDAVDLASIKVELSSSNAYLSPITFQPETTLVDVCGSMEEVVITVPEITEDEWLAFSNSSVVFYRDVLDEFGDLKNFDVHLSVSPNTMPANWLFESGPSDSGVLLNADQAEAVFSNPTKGGRYVFTVQVGDIMTDVQIWLPVSGPDISAEFQDQIAYLKDDWGPRYRAALPSRVAYGAAWYVLADPSLLIGRTENFRVDDIQSFALDFDYDTVVIENYCGLGQYSTTNDSAGDHSRFTMKGATRWYVTDFAKRNNMGYAMAARVMGFDEPTIIYSPDIYYYRISHRVGTPDSPAAHDSYRAGIALADGGSLANVIDTYGYSMMETNGRAAKEWPDQTTATMTYLELVNSTKTNMEAMTVSP